MTNKSEARQRQEMLDRTRQRAVEQIERALLNMLAVSYQLSEPVDLDAVINEAKSRVAIEADIIRTEIESLR